ncbi:MAG: T9SS type A sorting domain-containing protein [Cytophagales bacterium]|nr:T9SS type A sorting domain-containing protein [Cytophagales bacterium]
MKKITFHFATAIICVIFLNLCLPRFFGGSLCFSQITFQKTFGGLNSDETGRSSVQQTTDSGYVILGHTNNFQLGGSNVYVIKTDAAGDTMWTKIYGGGTELDYGYSVQQTTDGGYVIAGYTLCLGACGDEFYVIKTDTAGDIMWTKAYGNSWNDQGYSVQQTADGGYVIAGRGSTFEGDVYLIKTDTAGDIMWTKAYGNLWDDRGYSVQQTADGGYVIAGYTQSSIAGDFDVYVIKTDAAGDTMWTKVYGGTGFSQNDLGYSVQQTTDGGYVIAGYTESFGAGAADVYIIKTDSLGDTIWTKAYGGNGDDRGYSVQQTADGGYVIAGYTTSFGGGGLCDLPPCADVYVIKTDAAGDTMWTKVYGGNGDDRGYSVQQTADGGYVIAGYTESSVDGDFDVYVIKTDANGNTYGCNYPGTATVVSNTATQVSSGGSVSSVGIVSANITIVYNTSTVISDLIPTLSLSLSATTTYCDDVCDAMAIVNAIGSYPPFSYQWNDPLFQTDSTAYGLCAETYTVTVTDAYACTTATDSITIITVPFPQDSICLITVDSTSTKNVIVWKKPVTAGIDSFRIYRDIIGVYTYIGSVDYNSLSQFIDITNGVNPQVTSYRYKISTVDTCGNESLLSSFHETIHLITIDGGNKVDLIWDNYEGFNFGFYRILRDSTGTGNFEQIDSVTNTVNQWTDLTPPQTLNVDYVVAVVPNSGTCTATLQKVLVYNSARSNVTNRVTTGINNQLIPSTREQLQLTISPNPYTSATNIVYTVEEKAVVLLEVYNVLGKRIQTLVDADQNVGNYQYSFSARQVGYSSGVYILKFRVNDKVYARQLVEMK